VVILDEATCHVDSATEEQVEHAFAARGGTLIVIAHRLSSALRAQRVLVLDGAGMRLGTHHELLRESGKYADMFGHWTAGSPVAR
jgi:ATP-binding cassette, subfamily C, bacterial